MKPLDPNHVPFTYETIEYAQLRELVDTDHMIVVDPREEVFLQVVEQTAGRSLIPEYVCEGLFGDKSVFELGKHKLTVASQKLREGK